MADPVAVEERRIFMSLRSKDKINIKHMVMAAFLTALSIVLTRFLSVMFPEVRIGLGRVPLTLSGLLFGPLLGGISGAAADLVGMLLFPTGAYHPGFTISSMLDGLIPGLLAIYFRNNTRKGNPYTLLRIFLVQLITIVLNSVVLNTLWLTQYLGRGYLLILPARVINALVNLPIQTFLVYKILEYRSRFLKD